MILLLFPILSFAEEKKITLEIPGGYVGMIAYGWTSSFKNGPDIMRLFWLRRPWRNEPYG